MDPLILLARASGRIVDLICKTIEMLYDGVLPPILGYRRLQALTSLSYDRGGLYTTQTHNSSGLYAWEREAIGVLLSPRKRCMVLAAGGGRETIALLREGLEVDAWECSPRLREFGNSLLEKEGLRCRIEPMVPDRFPEITNGRSYDLCIVGWSAYCHILRRESRIDLLKSIGGVVNGPILLSFVGKSKVTRGKRMLRRIAGFWPWAAAGISHSLVLKPGIVCVGFDEEDVALEAREAGLSLIRYKDQTPENPYAVLEPIQELLPLGS
jgi:hypothetical protein